MPPALGSQNARCPRLPNGFDIRTSEDFLVRRNLADQGGVEIYFRYCYFVFSAYERVQDNKAEQLGHLTSLYSVGRSLLEYAVDVLGMMEMVSWLQFEKGTGNVDY